ncbi:MAG: hypothetical protein Q4D38_05120 [Planctomycetia bacterium]|nr:hypothetical protein [Planctomycetia bacterium]
MKGLLWRFRCAGSFGGVSSFKDEDEERYFMRVDFWGGKVSAEIDSARFSALSLRDEGVDVRVLGDVIFSSGSPRALVRAIVFDGDEGFKEVSFDESMQGMVVSGFCEILDKRHYSTDDGRNFFSASLKTCGGVLRRVPLTEELFSKLSIGLGVVSGNLVNEFSNAYVDGKRQNLTRSELLLTAWKPGVPREMK